MTAKQSTIREQKDTQSDIWSTFPLLWGFKYCEVNPNSTFDVRCVLKTVRHQGHLADLNMFKVHMAFVLELTIARF